MKRLTVVYRGWGEQWPLGTLADDAGQLMFEYSAEAIRRQLELSPLHLRLRQEGYANGPRFFARLPGLIADALPDGWGLSLMDRAFRRAGRDPATLSPLDRLAFVGERAIGALTFEPADTDELTLHDVSLLELAWQIGRLTTGASAEVLRELILIGGSPHGARPKALVDYNRASGRMTAGGPVAAHGDHDQAWLIKFPARGEHAEACAVEELYARLARECGIDMPETQFFALGRGLSAFGTRRFDRAGLLRVPVHTLAGALHIDFRIPSVDLVDFLRLTRLITGDAREVLRAFERCVFNLLFHNRDDHAKNFSYRLDRDDRWMLAPAYDLTYNEGPGGHHQMGYDGQTLAPARADALSAAQKGGITPAAAIQTIDRLLPVVDRIADLAQDLPIRKTTLKKLINSAIGERARLSR